MSHEPHADEGERPHGVQRAPEDWQARARASRAEFREQVNATKTDLLRQARARRERLEAQSAELEAKAGRNLVFAIGLGVVLGGSVLASLLFVKALFVIVAVALAVVGALELTTAFRVGSRRVPRIPAAIAAGALPPLAYFVGVHGLWLGVVFGVVLVWICQALLPLLPGRSRVTLRDLTAAVFVTGYVGVLAAFSALLAAQDHGQWWVLSFIVVTVVIDTGAYAAGATLGKHAMAPRISPNKSWEGFIGAAAAGQIAGILLAILLLDQPWYVGVVLGAVVLLTGTVGDLGESLIKRDLGIKDMSTWLPGHGGFLDRIDSILPSAAGALVLYVVVVGI